VIYTVTITSPGSFLCSKLTTCLGRCNLYVARSIPRDFTNSRKMGNKTRSARSTQKPKPRTRPPHNIIIRTVCPRSSVTECSSCTHTHVGRSHRVLDSVLIIILILIVLWNAMCMFPGWRVGGRAGPMQYVYIPSCRHRVQLSAAAAAAAGSISATIYLAGLRRSCTVIPSRVPGGHYAVRFFRNKIAPLPLPTIYVAARIESALRL